LGRTVLDCMTAVQAARRREQCEAKLGWPPSNDPLRYRLHLADSMLLMMILPDFLCPGYRSEPHMSMTAEDRQSEE
jgi:hypothetical protein